MLSQLLTLSSCSRTSVLVRLTVSSRFTTSSLTYTLHNRSPPPNAPRFHHRGRPNSCDASRPTPTATTYLQIPHPCSKPARFSLKFANARAPIDVFKVYQVTGCDHASDLHSNLQSYEVRARGTARGHRPVYLSVHMTFVKCPICNLQGLCRYDPLPCVAASPQAARLHVNELVLIGSMKS